MTTGDLSERVTFTQTKVEKGKTSGQGKRFQAEERTSVKFPETGKH